MTALDFEAVVKAVEGYWGATYLRLKFGPIMQDLVRRRFGEWTADELLQDLMHRRTHDMGGKEPPWDSIFASRKRDGGSTRNDFQVLIDNVKKFNRACGSDRWSDGEAFDHHLKMQTISYTTCAITKTVIPDADGRRARLAKNARASEYILWRGYFAGIGETCPDFLQEPTR